MCGSLLFRGPIEVKVQAHRHRRSVRCDRVHISDSQSGGETASECPRRAYQQLQKALGKVPHGCGASVASPHSVERARPRHRAALELKVARDNSDQYWNTLTREVSRRTAGRLPPAHCRRATASAAHAAWNVACMSLSICTMSHVPRACGRQRTTSPPRSRRLGSGGHRSQRAGWWAAIRPTTRKCDGPSRRWASGAPAPVAPVPTPAPAPAPAPARSAPAPAPAPAPPPEPEPSRLSRPAHAHPTRRGADGGGGAGGAAPGDVFPVQLVRAWCSTLDLSVTERERDAQRGTCGVLRSRASMS